MITQITSLSELEDTTSLTAILYFTAAWCGPCQSIAPMVDKFAESHKDVNIFKIDIDQAFETVKLYGIRGVPTFIALSEGAEVSRVVGSITQAKLESLAESARF